MGLKRGWLQEVENYISTLEEDLDYLNKENGQLRAKNERLRAALREIGQLVVDHTYSHQVVEIAREALGDD